MNKMQGIEIHEIVPDPKTLPMAGRSLTPGKQCLCTFWYADAVLPKTQNAVRRCRIEEVLRQCI